MRRSRLLLVLSSLAACSADPLGGEVDAPVFVPPLGEDAIPGSYLVYARGGAPPVEVADRLEASLGRARRFDSEDAAFDRVWRLRSEADWETVYRASVADSELVLVEPERRARVSAWTPDDPLFPRQWHLSDIGMPEAWELATGAGVTIAVLDTGVSAGPDGFGRLRGGIDIAGEDSDPSDVDGHGTHVAGTLAQASDNGVGTAGVALDATLLPVRVLGDTGTGSLADVADGVVWAVDEGADVINLSLGSGGGLRMLQAALRYAERNGVVVVAASGNDGADRVEFPAAYDTVLAVGAVDARGRVTRYSNRGPALSLVAPGGDTRSDTDRDGYVDGVLQEGLERGAFSFLSQQGTSMATPHVAGVAALLVELVGREPELVRDLLLSSARDGGSVGRDEVYGWGRLDAAAATALALELTAPPGLESELDENLPPEPEEDTPEGPEEERPSGAVWITELLANPADFSDDEGEYIEIWNDTTVPLDLSELELWDAAGNGGGLSSDTLVAPGGVAVLGRVSVDDWPWGAVELDGVYPRNLSLNNGGDSVSLFGLETELDTVTYGRSIEGVSLERQSDGSWAPAETTIPGATDLGSPGWLPD